MTLLTYRYKSLTESYSHPDFRETIKIFSTRIAAKLDSQSHMRSNPIVDATTNVRECGVFAANPSGDSSNDKRIDTSFNSPPKMHTDIGGRNPSRSTFFL